MQALRRGWYLGEESFKDKLLGLMDKAHAKIRKPGNHAGGAVRAHNEQEAERIIATVGAARGMSPGSGVSPCFSIFPLDSTGSRHENPRMARQLRFQYPGAVYHVMARGDGGKPLFIGKDDHESFVYWLERVCGSHGWLVHAWVLMGNHFHLLLETPEANLSAGMRVLLGTLPSASSQRSEPLSACPRRLMS